MNNTPPTPENTDPENTQHEAPGKEEQSQEQPTVTPPANTVSETDTKNKHYSLDGDKETTDSSNDTLGIP